MKYPRIPFKAEGAAFETKKIPFSTIEYDLPLIDCMSTDNIRLLMKYLPADYEAASKSTGAMRRTGRVIDSPSDLMWLILTHLSQGQTLVNMSALSKASGLGQLSDVAFMKRLVNCGEWFKWILQQLSPASVADYLKPKGLCNYRVLAVDASDVNSGVSRFSKSWHLHFALEIFTLTSHEFKITDNKTGETLVNFTATKGDLFLADRVYVSKKGISHCLSHEADFILRLRSDAFLMYLDNGERADLLKLLSEVETNEAVDIPVYVDLSDYGLGMKKMRVCALRKSEEDIEKAMKRIDSKSKQHKKISDGAKQFNEYIAVITSLPYDINSDEVLAAYRYRWQVELYFKRLKSLLGTGEVPKKRAECMETWLNGKMILAVLFEVLLSMLDFSPPEQGREETA
jgi:hypothetical protein